MFSRTGGNCSFLPAEEQQEATEGYDAAISGVAASSLRV
jgi:hypothetical protein